MAADPPEALPEPKAGFNLAMSVSNSPDLGRLGLTDTHLRMVLGEVARAVLIADGNLSYGGHLGEDGFTTFLVHECEKYRRRDQPFTGYVPWSVHRSMTVEDVVEHQRRIGLLGDYVFLDVEGNPIADPVANRTPGPEDLDPADVVNGLTRMRAYWTDRIDGRLVVGGAREGSQGRMPGIVEEAILTIQADKPLFVAGGFGGAAGDIARTLGMDPDNWLGLDPAPARADLMELANTAAAAGWTPTRNGLTNDQNRQLAISYRASEIASFVVHGLINRQGTA